ncbi:MAG: S9 family peptidase, partial [Stenotrophomonas sp.]
MLRSGGIHRHARLLVLGLICAASPLLALATAPPAPDEAAFSRSLQLREQWMYLTRGLAGPATWSDAQRYRYRRTVPGGFEFVSRSVDQAQAVPVFDQARLATALSPLLGRSVDGRRLPFSDYTLEDDGRALRAWIDGAWMRCELAEAYRCARWSEPGPSPRPRGWGVVRDLSVAADDTPQRSPDGRHEAQVRDASVIVRNLADGGVRVLAR